MFLYFSYNQTMSKKIFIFFLLLSFPFLNFATNQNQTFIDEISASSKISLVQVTYTEPARKYFSKLCLRIYDKENNFDKIIDFAYFDEFDEIAFPLKFYFSKINARINISNFFDFYNYEAKKNRSHITEILLNLSEDQSAYLYNFVAKLATALPDYSYEYDIKKQNSSNFIDSILKDTTEYIPNELPLVKINKEILFPISRNIKSQFYFIELEKNKIALILISVLTALLTLLTTYQMLTLFNKTNYHSSVFYISEIIDFLIFFISGLFGLVFFYLFAFSQQYIFKHSFHFLIFNPLNFFISFLIFFQMNKTSEENNSHLFRILYKNYIMSNKQFYFIYWSFLIFLVLLYAVLRLVLADSFPIYILLVEICFLIRYSWYLIDSIFNTSIQHSRLS